MLSTDRLHPTARMLLQHPLHKHQVLVQQHRAGVPTKGDLSPGDVLDLFKDLPTTLDDSGSMVRTSLPATWRHSISTSSTHSHHWSRKSQLPMSPKILAGDTATVIAHGIDDASDEIRTAAGTTSPIRMVTLPP